MNTDTLEKDFNTIFWKIFGVNHRVYKVSDIFHIARDKQADEKIYNNFIANDEILSNKKILEYNSKEADDFYELFRLYLIGRNKNTDFYLSQLNNIVYNFKLFKKVNFTDYNYIDLFAFQIATILEHMSHNKYDVNLFNKAIKEKSIVPFLDYCKKTNNIKTNKALSIEMSYALDRLIEHWSKTFETGLTSVIPATFEKDISNWKKNKKLPSFINILTLINVMFENNKNDVDALYAILFQLLVARALLHIEKEYNLNEETKNKFLNRLQFFRNEINSIYTQESQRHNFETLQGKYLIDISNTVENSTSFSTSFEPLSDKIKSFINNVLIDNEEVTINMPNINEITSLFNEKRYSEILNLLIDNDNNDSVAIVINNANNCMRFLIAIKLEDTTLIKKSYKYFDRLTLGCMLSISDIKHNSKDLINMFKNIETLEKCMVQMNIYLKEKLSTLE